MLFARAVTFVVAVVALVGANDSNEKKCDGPIMWTGGSFEWPCVTTKSMFKNSGRYISKNVLATRVAIYKDDAILALPRYKPGVPVTLAKVSLKDKTSCQATLLPFPCWSLQEEGTCSALQNVVDLFLDPQDILWVLDTGVVNSLEQPERKCPPKVVALNVKTGKIVKIVDLSGLTSATSRLQYVIADYNPDGRVFIYVSDAATRAILVYDVTSGRGYRVVLPQAVTLSCDRRDVLYLALTRHNDGSTCLFFSYLGSSRVFSIRTDYLRSGNAHGKIQDRGAKPKRMIILGTDNGSAIFFRFEGEGEVYRWDSATPFQPCNFQPVYKNRFCECNLPTHIVPDYKRGQMRVLESNFQDFMQGTVGCGANHMLSLM